MTSFLPTGIFVASRFFFCLPNEVENPGLRHLQLPDPVSGGRPQMEMQAGFLASWEGPGADDSEARREDSPEAGFWADKTTVSARDGRRSNVSIRTFRAYRENVVSMRYLFSCI